MQLIIVIGIVAIALSVLIRGIYLTFTGEKGCKCGKCGNGFCPFLNDERYWWHQDIPCTTGEKTDGCTK